MYGLSIRRVVVVAIGVGSIVAIAQTAPRNDSLIGTKYSRDDPIVPKHHAVLSQDNTPTTGATLQVFGQEARTIDGTGNNVANPAWGSAGGQLVRISSVEYGDGISTPAGASRPSARTISNAGCAQSTSIPNLSNITDFLWLWGQFVDHDIVLSALADPEEPFDIPVPMGDPSFDPMSTGTQIIPMTRVAYDPTTGTSMANPREQTTHITAYIDASNVYGSDLTRAAALRTNDETGKLAVSAGDLPAYNTGGLPNAGGPSPSLFLAGDVRANEHVALTAMHTLFMREHNRLADEIVANEPGLSGEEIYQRARLIVGAEMQVITYKEFLPLLLGPGALSPYTGYDPSVNAGITNIFAAACYRLGHSMLSSDLWRLDAAGRVIAEGHIALRDAFFAPARMTEGGGISPLLRGAATHVMQEMDTLLVDDVRNFLFGEPGSGGLDLAAINIQRGRDHGLPDYNQARVDFGLAPVSSFSDITSNAAMQAELQSLYGSVNDVDVWVGALAEDHLPGAIVGELLLAVIADQFEALRDGDRFWYQSILSGSLLAEVEGTTLADVIRRNTMIDQEIQDNVFLAVLAPSSVCGDNVREAGEQCDGSDDINCPDECSANCRCPSDTPAVSEWGLIVLVILLLVGIAFKFGHRRPRTP